jgi:hypothetical protein
MDVLKYIQKQKMHCLNLGLIGKLLELREIEKVLLEELAKKKLV